MFSANTYIVKVLGADDWDRCDNLFDLATYFGNPRREPTPSEQRKFRLLVVAALRALWPHIPTGNLRAAVEIAERFADDGDLSALRVVNAIVEEMWQSFPMWPDPGYPGRVVVALAQAIMNGTADSVTTPSDPRWKNILSGLSFGIPGRTQEQANSYHLQLFREIIPNPFRRIWFDSDWRTSTAVALASQMYESRDFGAMPILADALQDAGCDNEEVLSHCRGPGPHVRGCWVVDLVRGKS